MFAKFICQFFAPLFTSKAFIDAITDRLPLQEIVCDLAKHVNPDAVALRLVDRVIDQVDMAEVSQKVAHLISASDVAEYIDNEDVASHVDVDADKVAESIDMSELVEAIDKDKLADRVCEQMSKDVDYSKLAEEVDMSNLCEELDYSELANNLDVDYSELANNFDDSGIASEMDASAVAEHISLSDLAGELDYEDIASHICAKDVAEELDCSKEINDAVQDYLCNNDDMIDYKALAKAIIAELAIPKVEMRPVFSGDKPMAITDSKEVNA
jgi:hypothetical protein